MKFLQDWASLACLQLAGQAMRTVLCFIPPRPADWMRWEKPSLRLEDTTTWQKPLVRSAAMEVLMFWTQKHNSLFSDGATGHKWRQNRV